jgi:hypothetical protein
MGDNYSCVCLFWCLDLYHFIREINHLITQSKCFRACTIEGAHTRTHTRARAFVVCRIWEYLFSGRQLWKFIGTFSLNFVFISHYTARQLVQNFKEVQLLEMMLQRDRKLVQRCLFDCYKSLVKRLLEMLKWLAYGWLVILH